MSGLRRIGLTYDTFDPECGKSLGRKKWQPWLEGGMVTGTCNNSPWVGKTW